MIDVVSEQMLVFALCVGLMLVMVVLIILICYTLVRFRHMDNCKDRTWSRQRDAFLYMEALINDVNSANIKTSTDVENLQQNLENLRADIKRLEISMERFAPGLDPDTEYKNITITGKIK